MESFRLPAVAPWDGRCAAEHELGTIALLFDRSCPTGIYAPFDQRAVFENYREVLESGYHAFIESHYGVEQADAWDRTVMEGYESAKEVVKLYRELNPVGFAVTAAYHRRAGLRSVVHEYG
ncbi:hypothetical protein L226DRAFT_523063 [Lentinus tigrinus ALCF2SS1-7]|uniref:Uncharacterized protein n=1 Tax=Lentinus tigrinus ALCF2SS1-6 TaxID=1328759 RepID=A0A5C2S9U1_9APHY|nr:hypothetical protein L227DRAFT_563675 [Lentinus tigrinus ALCF2SS1-6]RPD74730.1 hypothetical protein L226DRAFT_523063 [Lentinus tigrinus ALCF2SS1-7]